MKQRHSERERECKLKYSFNSFFMAVRVILLSLFALQYIAPVFIIIVRERELSVCMHFYYHDDRVILIDLIEIKSAVCTR